jgi:hypothetical protein
MDSTSVDAAITCINSNQDILYIHKWDVRSSLAPEPNPGSVAHE